MAVSGNSCHHCHCLSLLSLFVPLQCSYLAAARRASAVIELDGADGSRLAVARTEGRASRVAGGGGSLGGGSLGGGTGGGTGGSLGGLLFLRGGGGGACCASGGSQGGGLRDGGSWLQDTCA